MSKHTPDTEQPKQPWIIHDWAGRHIFPRKRFDTFEDGWEFVRSQRNP